MMGNVNKLKEGQWTCKTESLFAIYEEHPLVEGKAYLFRIKVRGYWHVGRQRWSIPLVSSPTVARHWCRRLPSDLGAI